jgi:hypothetical protein
MNTRSKKSAENIPIGWNDSVLDARLIRRALIERARMLPIRRPFPKEALTLTELLYRANTRIVHFLGNHPEL